MQLIQINSSTINSEVKQTVNARDLHSFLEVGKDFSNWIKDRIESFGFVENQDFAIFANSGEKGRPAKEYALTLDMAKELSMVERNEKGKQARQYFIECERRAQNPLSVLSDPAAMRNLLLTYTEKVLTLEHKVDELAPRAAVADRIAISDGLYNLTHAAKIVGKAPRLFNQELHKMGWIYRMGVKGPWTGYGDKVKSGLVAHKMHSFEHSDGTPDTAAQVFITAKGMHRLADIFNVEAELSEAA